MPTTQPSPLRISCLIAAAAFSTAALAQRAQAASSCQAVSKTAPPTVLELYTSEGCSSCPPADRWLSTLKGRSDVLALAFHVTYWDRLGWPDRFALAEGTARQHELAQLAGSRQVYTPQIVVNGKDWPQWQRAPLPAAATAAVASAVSVKLKREGQKVTADVGASSGSAGSTSSQTAKLSGYWAVLEDQHESKVRAGENAGETLRHDHVVRLYKPVAAWAAAAGSSHQITVSPGLPQHPRRVVFVVTDAVTQKPVQAAALAC